MTGGFQIAQQRRDLGAGAGQVRDEPVDVVDEPFFVREEAGDDFRDRVLPFDDHCASRYADIVCGRETLGRPIGVADAQIAAICRTLDAALATRNTGDFSETGIELINPWKLDRPTR